jgi:hypothetical protein
LAVNDIASAAIRAVQFSQHSPGLTSIFEAWCSLSPHVREAITLLVDSMTMASPTGGTLERAARGQSVAQ